MLLVCDMGGSHHSCRLTAYVANCSWSNMPYCAQKGDIQWFDTINCRVWLLHCCPNSVMELLSSLLYNQPPARTCMYHHQHSRWGSPGYCCRRILGWLVWESLLWCLGIQSFSHLKQSFLYPPMYRQHENFKKRQYKIRIKEVEHSTFTSLVSSTTGSLGPAAGSFYK